jgi:Asp-tRNA(Asn)/Glu-tRNA(Gln) amidotransferase A subunit family amidase
MNASDVLISLARQTFSPANRRLTMHYRSSVNPLPRQIRALTVGISSAAALALAIAWQSSAPAVAKSADVPFRLMEATIRETQAALEAGTVTSEELVRMYLARIEAYDEQGPSLNALNTINQNALNEARALDRERRRHRTRGPLHGIPVLLKDNYDTFDMPTTNSSLSLATSVPPDDAYLVRRLREAGAVFVGKTNLHEFARGITTISSLGGQTLNPYDVRRNPGGSSGGTGAAVAANFAVFGMGSDTCGSIRIPSSHNSLVGLRATQGLFSRDGIIPLSLTQDMGGPLARTVEDLAIVLDLTAGFDPNDPVTAVSELHTPRTYTKFLKTGRLRGARFGLLIDALIVDAADSEVADVIQAARRELELLGATVVEVTVPNYTAISNPSVIGMEFKFNLEAYLAATPAAPFRTLQQIIDSGLFHPSLLNGLLASQAVVSLDTPEYRQRLEGREIFKTALLDVLTENNLDALIYPTIRQKPIFVPATNQPGTNCRVSAHSGLPAISVPVGFTPDGLPVGMEFLGRDFTEGDLLRIAYSWEQATHVRRVPASTPVIEPRWSYEVTDGIAAFHLDVAGRQFRFTAPGADTFVYIDPGMRSSKSIVHGELKDDRWHIRYVIRTLTPGSSTIWVKDLWAGGPIQVLHGPAIPRS